MPGLGIADVRSMGNAATLYQWNLQFVTPPNAVSTAVLVDSNGGPLNIRCESVELPNKTNEKFITAIRGHRVRQAGIADYGGTLSLVFVETVDNAISQFIVDWQEAVWATGTGIQQSMVDLVGTMEIHRLNNLDEEVWKYKMDVWLESSTLGTLDGNTSDAFKPNVVFSFDDFISEPMG